MRKRLITFFTTNRSVKIGSLLMALVIWSFAVSGATRTDLFPGTIPITVEHTPNNLAASLNVDTVQVRISAEEAVWRQLKSNSFSATVDLTNLGVGVTEVPVQIAVLVPNVQLVDAIPRTVVVQLEPVSTISLPVTIQSQGTPANGFFPSDATSDPKTVLVTGATSLIARLDRVSAVVDVNGANSDQDASVPVQVLDASGHALTGLTVNPRTVLIHQTLTKLATTKTVGVQVVTSGTPPDGKLIAPAATKPLTVTIAGSQAQVTATANIATKPIDISKITDKQTVKATLDIPNGITVSDSQTVDVTFAVTDQNTVRSIGATINYTNLPSGLHVTNADPAAPTVVVQGPASVLAKLSATDAVLTIDLAGLGAGQHLITLLPGQLTLPGGVTLQQITTTATTVTLQ